MGSMKDLLGDTLFSERPGVQQAPLLPGFTPLVVTELVPGVPTPIVLMFERFALEAINAGLTRYSARAIFHRMRWHERIERGNREFKINNNWSSAVSRWFLARHPAYADFFETRNQSGDDED